jgi:dolichyl-phosphate-mannose-protein mannosyltransferase
MSAPASVRHRGQKNKRPTTPNPEAIVEKDLDIIVKATKEYTPSQGSEWDYKLAISVITVLAFVTRFWGIQHPNQVVFDEVHFGKVCSGASAYKIPGLAATAFTSFG